MDQVSFESAQHVSIEYELATPMKRLGAAVLDFILFLSYFLLVSIFFGVSNIFYSPDLSSFFFLMIIRIPWVVYNPVMEYFNNGQTLGKKIAGIRVVTINGERPGMKEAMLRWIFKGDFVWISADFLILIWVLAGIAGFFVSFISPRHQRLGDFMAGTVVVETKDSRKYTLKDVLSIKNNENYQPAYPQVISFTDEDMLLIKKTLQRVKRNASEETKQFGRELAEKTAELLGLEQVPDKKIEFLQTVLQDYVVLTR